MASVAGRRIVIEVVYAEAGRQTLVELEVEPGTTVAQAIGLSGIGAEYPGVNFAGLKVGIFGKLVPPATVLRERDRVEIYRPLRADPKEARRRRAGSGAGKKKA
jgi:putative ubiquitin-RnfH superfamily antitoxin RatB of RatAB toxin-antitoxin module